MIYRLAKAKYDDVFFVASVVAAIPDTGAAAARRLLTNAALSKVWVAVREDVDTPAAVWGAAHLDHGSQAAHYWMLAFEPFRDVPQLDLINRLVIEEMLDEFDMLENYVDTRCEETLILLKTLGFTIEPADPQPDGRLLHYVWIARARVPR